MRVPSEKALSRAFPHITIRDIKLIRSLGWAAEDADRLSHIVDNYLPNTAKYVRSMYSSPYSSHAWRVSVALHGMNEVMGTYGVEALGPDVGSPKPPPYEYLNTGDTYATTLIYRRKDNSLIIGSWGDIAEKIPELGRTEDVIEIRRGTHGWQVAVNGLAQYAGLREHEAQEWGLHLMEALGSEYLYKTLPSGVSFRWRGKHGWVRPGEIS